MNFHSMFCPANWPCNVKLQQGRTKCQSARYYWLFIGVNLRKKHINLGVHAKQTPKERVSS